MQQTDQGLNPCRRLIAGVTQATLLTVGGCNLGIMYLPLFADASRRFPLRKPRRRRARSASFRDVFVELAIVAAGFGVRTK